MNCHYCPLKHESLLHISGPDALTFLQGQTTCDTRQVNAEHALIGAYCTPQGRVVCDFLLCQLGPDHYAMRMRRGIRDTSSSVFGKYIIFSKASLDAQREDWQVFAVWGPEAAAALKEIFGHAPKGKYDASTGADYVVVQTDDLGEQFECYYDSTATPGVPAQFETLMTPGTASEWEALQIASGIARVEAATSGEFVPQTLNYDLTGHISFDKGCYTGQEVVARLHYRGTPKRRTYLAQLDNGEPGSAGSALYSTQGEQSVGNIVNTTAQPKDNLALVMATSNAVQEALHIGSPEGAVLHIIPLPYSLEPDQAAG